MANWWDNLFGRTTTTSRTRPTTTTSRPRPTADTAERRAQQINVPNTVASPTVTQETYTSDVGPSDGSSYSVQEAPAAPTYTQEDIDRMAEKDQQFVLQKAAADAALQAYINDIGAQRNRYNVDYDTSLRKLGFSGNSGVLDTAKFDPAKNAWLDAAGAAIAAPGTWNTTDVNTASGRGFENILNDFAARGMLRSSAYGKARSNLERSLNEQLSSAAQARTNALADWTRAETAKTDETTNATAQALAEAASRIKAQLGIA